MSWLEQDALLSIKNFIDSIFVPGAVAIQKWNFPLFFGHKRDAGMDHRGFSYEVISSQFCKSSYSQPPCWFPFAWPGIVKYMKMSQYFLFSSYHNTKLRLSEKNIKTHTLCWNFKSCYEVNQKQQHVLLFFFLYPAMQKETKERVKIVCV